MSGAPKVAKSLRHYGRRIPPAIGMLCLLSGLAFLSPLGPASKVLPLKGQGKSLIALAFHGFHPWLPILFPFRENGSHLQDLPPANFNID